MTNDAPILSLRNVKKTYAAGAVETSAVDGVNLDIREGDFCAIVGRSGSGKSTLLSILGLLEAPSSGEYRLDGVCVNGLNATQLAALRNKHIGFVFQAYNLISDMSVLENVMLPLSFRKPKTPNAKDKALAALKTLSIAHRAEHYPPQLSGGEQQRAAIARALVGDPTILLADEPTGNLDSDNANAVMEILQELNRNGATICMVTHNPDEARIATRQVEMFDGKIVQPAPAEVAPAPLAAAEFG